MGAADKERLDKQFAESLKKLDERIKLEKSLAGWTYVVAAKSLEPLLKERAQLVAAPRKPPDTKRSCAIPSRISPISQ